MSQHDWRETLSNDPRTFAELVQCALTESDGDRAWEAILVCHFRPTREVFDAATGLCVSANPKERGLGADILGQFGCFEKQPYPFFDETVERLVAMLSGEQDPEVLNAIGFGLSHRQDARGVEPLSKLKCHPHEDVRHAVVMGLDGQTEPLAIQTLIDLTRDEVTKVRDSATFTLGQCCDIDTPAIREALWQRTDDPDDTTRSDALLGLAQRHDERIIPKLIAELRREAFCIFLIGAAGNLGSPLLLEVLYELKGFTIDEPDHRYIDKDIANCTRTAVDLAPSTI